jgi:hypothetical protein
MLVVNERKRGERPDGGVGVSPASWDTGAVVADTVGTAADDCAVGGTATSDSDTDPIGAERSAPHPASMVKTSAKTIHIGRGYANSLPILRIGP